MLNPNRHSSSSATRQPSERTIDLSAWSPRSHQLTTRPQNPSFLLLKMIAREIQKNSQTMKSPLPNTIQPSPSTIDGVDCLQIVPYRNSNDIATQNPNPPNDNFHLFASLFTYPTPLPNPIAINLFLSLQTMLCHAFDMGAAPKFLLTPNRSHATPLVQCYPPRSPSERDILMRLSRTITLNPKIIAQSALQMEAFTGPKEPKTTAAQPWPLPLNQAQPEYSPLSIPNQLHCHSDTIARDSPLASHADSPLVFQLQLHHKNTHDTTTQGIEEDSIYPYVIATEDQLSLEMSPIHPTDLTLPGTNRTQKIKNTKDNSIPTRRSQRLRERTQANLSTHKASMIAKIKMAKLNFTDDSHLIPLDTSKSLQILQATGLQITKQIEDIIEEAVQQDQLPQQTMPSTPLHDSIPPRIIPGMDMFL